MSRHSRNTGGWRHDLYHQVLPSNRETQITVLCSGTDLLWRSTRALDPQGLEVARSSLAHLKRRSKAIEDGQPNKLSTLPYCSSSQHSSIIVCRWSYTKWQPWLGFLRKIQKINFPENEWIKKIMVPSESVPQELSNEWSRQYVSTILNFLGNFYVPPLATEVTISP
jgi:hypothetical protein